MSTTPRFRFIGFALTIVLAMALPAAAQTMSRPDKLDGVLRARARQFAGRSRVIVQFKNAPDVRVITAERGAAGRALGARAQVAELDNRALATLAANPGVDRVMIDRPAFATMERTGAAVGATLARQEYGLTGRGVGVAVIDSGISSWHPDLYLRNGRSRVVHFKDFTRPASSRVWTNEVPTDDYGHGTHVAGIIAGNGLESDGRRTGIAPGVNLVGLRVLDGEGHGYISDVIAAIDYAISIRRAYNIRVINLSVGAGVFESYRLDPLALAARRAVEAGIVVVTAAGNLGLDENGHVQYGGITSPGNAPWVLTVGAASHQGTARRSDDVMATFSSRGPTWLDFAAKPDLVAPGVGIESLAAPQSTLYSTLSDYLLDGTHPTGFKPYLSLSGTSMAAPVVAASVALLFEANPSLTPNAVKAILQYTAQQRAVEPMLAQGAGLLNTHGAIRMARFFANPKRGLPRDGDTIESEWIPWAKHIVWGNYRVRGGVPLPGSNAWATNVQWGALQTQTGDAVIWGSQNLDNIVWSTAADDNIVWSTAAADNIVWSTAGALADNIVWSTSADENIVWSTATDDNIVWSTVGDDNIVWSTATVENVVWGNDCGGRNCRRVIWGAPRNGSLWGTASTGDNIVWSTAIANTDNIVWSTAADDNIVWSTAGDENIVWSTATDDNIVWSTWAAAADNIVWSTSTDENIVWSTAGDDNIVWSTAGFENIVWSTSAAAQVVWPAR